MTKFTSYSRSFIYLFVFGLLQNSLSINQGSNNNSQRSTTPSNQQDYSAQYYQQPYQHAYQSVSVGSYQPTQSYAYQTAAHQPCAYQSNQPANHLSYAASHQHSNAGYANSHIPTAYQTASQAQQAYVTPNQGEMQYGIPTNLDLLAQQNLASGLINVSAQLAQQVSSFLLQLSIDTEVIRVFTRS